MTFWDCLQAFIFGALGFLITYLGQRLVKGAHVRQQFRHANDRAMELVHQIANSKNETILLEHELAELLEQTPVNRARWILQMRDLAHSVPPMVLHQIRRYGLAEPPPDDLEVAEVRPQFSQQSSPLSLVHVEADDPWTGQRRSG